MTACRIDATIIAPESIRVPSRSKRTIGYRTAPMLATGAPAIVVPRVTALAAEPAVVDGAIHFAVPHEPGLRRVSLRHELTRPRVLPFERRGARWELRLEPPAADRFEYLLELERVTGRELVPDPANPLRARGPFGEKSVVELPTYDAPEWVGDEVTRQGTLRGLRLESRRLRSDVGGLLWSAADTDPTEPLPLLIVHDGPEYAEFADLLRCFDHLMDFGDVPDFRAALLAPPGDRNESYSASARYGNALAAELLPALADGDADQRRARPRGREPRRARRPPRPLAPSWRLRRPLPAVRAASSGAASTGTSRGSRGSPGSPASSAACTAGAATSRACRP